MKKLLALILAAIMVLSMAACGGKETPSTGTLPAEGRLQRHRDRPRLHQIPSY